MRAAAARLRARSARHYTGTYLASGARRLAHKAAYKCNWRADRIAGVEAEKQHSINRYAPGGLTKEAYIALNLSLDAEIQRLRKRNRLDAI